MPGAIAIAGIHTGIGKTIVSAVLTEALQADYWKPIQAGSLEASDSMTVQELISNNKTYIHPEAVRLQMAASPHTAAQQEGTKLDFKSFNIPATANTLLIETAGGLLSPVDDKHTVADLVQFHQLPVILVIQHYLGSINHSLLCLEVLQSRNIPLLAVIFNGEPEPSSETFIKGYRGHSYPFYSIPAMPVLNKETVQEQAGNISAFIQTIIHNYDAAGKR